jgi:hypothetical protein
LTVSRFENPAQFDNTYPHVAPSRGTLKTLLMLAALLAYIAGFVALYPIVAGSVAKSVSDGNDPVLLQSVGF